MFWDAGLGRTVLGRVDIRRLSGENWTWRDLGTIWAFVVISFAPYTLQFSREHQATYSFQAARWCIDKAVVDFTFQP